MASHVQGGEHLLETSMTVQMYRQAICEIGSRLWQRGMADAASGNISVRLGPDRYLCTPTGVSKGFLRPEDLPVVDGTGSTVEGDTRPSSEIRMHLRVYQVDPDVGAVVHAHPMYATVWAVKGEAICGRLLPETAVLLPEVPLAGYGTPSTDAVPDSVEPFVHTHRACLLEQHGALAWGHDLEDAYLMMERVEYTAQLTFLLRQIGVQRYLPEEEIARLRTIFGPH
jgi:L-fuculose-phosphate aldolase